MKSIAILGANGRLAYEVLHAFHHAGYRVIAVTRNKRVRNMPPGIECRVADALRLAQLKKAVRGVDIIFNGLNPPYTEWTHSAIPMARHVIEAARSTRAVHLFPGNVYNYGKTIPAVCDEHTPFVGGSANGIKGKIRVEMEKLFAIAAEKYAIPTFILRAGDFYGGSGTGSWFDLVLVDKLQQGRFVYPGPADVEHAWAYLPDLAQAFVLLAERAQHLERFTALTYPGHTLTGQELQRLTEQACGRSLTPLGFPWKLIRMGGLLVPMWREIAEVSYLWSRPHRLSGQKLAECLGTVPGAGPARAVHEALQVLGKLP